MKIPPTVEKIWKSFVRLHIALYRLTGGSIVGKNTILITTIGRKTGKHHTHALLSTKDGNDFIVIASYGGSDKHPNWYRNLQANPQVRVEDHGRRVSCLASTVTDEKDYQRLWAQMCALYPPYNQYQSNTSRTIPVVRLSPIEQ